MARDMAGHVELRLAREADRLSLERLAGLDAKRAPTGPALVAVLDGEVVAALPLRGEPAIADPFRPTAMLVHLLELRAEALRGGRTRGRRLALLARVRPWPARGG